MTFTVIIPARYGSTRLPGKALLEVAGKPLLQHVYERARLSDAEQVLIATDDERIRASAESFGAPVQMTSSAHRSGTDRIAEVVRRRPAAARDVIVNVQGDEPLLPPALINQVAALLAADDGVAMSTLCEPITCARDLFNPSVVKVVMDSKGHALYFSRAPIPWHRESFQARAGELPAEPGYFRHLGLYAYTVEALLNFVSLPPSPLEVAESLEQLRMLGDGRRIAVAEALSPSGPGVDTASDLARVRALLGTDCP